MTRPDGKTEDIGCDALILACCGYGGDKAMIAKYIPEMVNAHYHGHTGNTGDAVKWGEALGASIKDMGSFQGHGAVATPHNMHIGWPAITEGGFQVNEHGKRFSNENEGYSEQALKVARQPDHVAWPIFDERGHRIAMQMHSHVEAEKAGALKVCDTPEEIARVDRLRCGDARADHEGGRGRRGGEEEGSLRPRLHRQAAARSRPTAWSKVMGALFHTQGGLEVDKEMRVLRKDGTPFPNLFAGGGAARGLSGPADWGYLSGSGLMTATNMGRLAGEAAAALAKG